MPSAALKSVVVSFVIDLLDSDCIFRSLLFISFCLSSSLSVSSSSYHTSQRKFRVASQQRPGSCSLIGDSKLNRSQSVKFHSVGKLAISRYSYRMEKISRYLYRKESTPQNRKISVSFTPIFVGLGNLQIFQWTHC
jgi:hypothetical protein